jgi:hypothetical protein
MDRQEGVLGTGDVTGQARHPRLAGFKGMRKGAGRQAMRVKQSAMAGRVNYSWKVLLQCQRQPAKLQWPRKSGRSPQVADNLYDLGQPHLAIELHKPAITCSGRSILTVRRQTLA